MTDDRRIKLLVVELPIEAGVSYDQAHSEQNMRIYVSRKTRRCLPGDVDLVVQTAAHGGWTIDVYENPDKGG